MNKLIEIAKTFNVYERCRVLFEDSRFAVCPGSISIHHHHHQEGGLVIHTTEVVELCLLNNEYFKDKGVNPAHLFIAALFHDCGKMWDYVKFEEFWTAAEHKYLIHHLPKSAMICRDALKIQIEGELNFTEQEIEDIIHAILAHHGQREWGSPVSPRTHLAWLLHLCDSLSARMDDGVRIY